MLRAWIFLVAVLLTGCSTTHPGWDSTARPEASGVSSDAPVAVCPNCGTVLLPRASRCPGCGQKQYAEEELRRIPEMRIRSPYSDPPNPWRPVDPITQEEIKNAKERFRHIKHGMTVEQVEATLGLSRFAGQRLIGSGSISLSIHYDLGNQHTLDMVYDRHFHPSSIDFELSGVVLDVGKSEMQEWQRTHK